jgi:uncharacterized cupin superfamily protein
MAIRISRIEDLPAQHEGRHENYEFIRRQFVRRGEANSTLVGIYEIPPGKSAYPYHYHHKAEETFYILRGEGTLKTPDGEKAVRAGDLLFFPANESGAHKLTNTGTDILAYIDFDVIHDLDAAVYPDSGKIGVWGKEVNRVFPTEAAVDYFAGE